MNDDMGYGFFGDDSIYSEHPDPAWARRNWIPLDGTWKIAHKGREEEIQVPFPIGSEAAGVDFRDSGTFTYTRSFDLPGFGCGKRYLLRIGACDYEAKVSVNGKEVGWHRGGYASFSFDITEAAVRGKNRLEIRVRDSHSPFMARGKQTFLRNPFFVWYAGTTGIWQSVWIEETGSSYLRQADLRPDFTERVVEGSARLASCFPAGAPLPAGAAASFGLRLELETVAPDGSRRRFTISAPDAEGVFRLRFSFDDIGAILWSVDRPELYALHYRLYDGDEILDTVESYLGLRKIDVDKGGFCINGERTYLRMVLVQGYYPGGSYAPTTFRRMEEDIRAIKGMGFNGARIHEKVENPYFHYLCDRLGLMTSFEMPSFYLPSRRAFASYESELRELIERDSMHPSCIMRMLFNETWGIWGMYNPRSKTRRFVLDMIGLAKKLDSTRPVIENSGWEHIRTDVADLHHYLKTSALAREVYDRIRSGDQETLFGFSPRRALAFYIRNQVSTKTRSLFLEERANTGNVPRFLSEYGGFGWYETEEKDAVIENIERYTRDIVDSGLFCGYCYTQLYDVGAEVNGLLGFDRRPKVDADRVRAANGK